jgi:uridine kinase
VTGAPVVTLDAFTAMVSAARAATTPARSFLVAVSGIDGAGKGFVAARLAEGLKRRGLRVALIGAYRFADVDVIVLEGVFLLRRDLRHHYDLSLWVECSFATALARAVARGQEGLPPAETAEAFETIDFPAQRVHFAADDPRAAADAIVVNDPGRLDADPSLVHPVRPAVASRA